MSDQVRLCLVLHNHQPVGNFDGVFEQAYQDSYAPFLDVFEPYENLKISLHTSGPLLTWISAHHPEYIQRLKSLVAFGRIEIVGGAFYEPILTMIPHRDRVGQIQSYSEWLTANLAADVRGMWIPERVWEQSLTEDIAAAGISYSVLDDFHFRNAGLEEEQLFGHYVTEDHGRLLYLFPGSERLRYLVPFADPQQTIDYLGSIKERRPGSVVVFGDDGEKFGTWPETHKHVYEDGWLRRFFDLLNDHRDWIHTTTLAETIDNVAPLGKIYLPDGSYREMTEWALPVTRQRQTRELVHQLENDERFAYATSFIRGGFWRNFKVKYPESDEMYARMMMVSRRFAEADNQENDDELVEKVRHELYRGQCNCSYWHGAFGGIYLPHLRNAVYHHLINAECYLDQLAGKPATFVEASADDFNFDGHSEVRLANERLIGLFAPQQGGQLYELDVRSIAHNLGATLARREEAYHDKVAHGPSEDGADVASIHDRVVFKQDGLENKLHYDDHRRHSLVDHFFDAGVTVDQVAAGVVPDLAGFFEQPYEAVIRRKPERIQLMLSATGQLDGHAIKITKGVTLNANSSRLEIAYLLENLPTGRQYCFAPEFNFAGLPAGQDDRYFFNGDRVALGQLGSQLTLPQTRSLGLADEWLGIRLSLNCQRDTNFWAYPVESVSLSEGGFELVHQAVCVIPHWQVQGDRAGQWSAQLTLEIETTVEQTTPSPKTAAMLI